LQPAAAARSQKICYKNFLHKTPETKTQQNPKNSKQRKRERERESHTQQRERPRERERERGEERRRNEKKLQIWELKLRPSLAVFLSPRAENKEKSASLRLFPWVSFFLVFFGFVEFLLVLLSSSEFCTWGGT
jgi:hypothetical protein